MLQLSEVRLHIELEAGRRRDGCDEDYVNRPRAVPGRAEIDDVLEEPDIESTFQLEESEIIAEPMPTRDDRKGVLFYEATEGGAGVLTRLVAEPERLATVARAALAIMHFDVEPFRRDGRW